MNDPAEKAFVERRSAWSFTVVGGKWVWTVVRPDKTERTSETPFDSLTDCIEAAVRLGYVPLKPAVERRGRRAEDASADGAD